LKLDTSLLTDSNQDPPQSNLKPRTGEGYVTTLDEYDKKMGFERNELDLEFENLMNDNNPPTNEKAFLTYPPESGVSNNNNNYPNVGGNVGYEGLFGGGDGGMINPDEELDDELAFQLFMSNQQKRGNDEEDDDFINQLSYIQFFYYF